MYRRVRTTEQNVLRAIRDRLRDKVEAYNDQNCVLLEQPIPEEIPGGQEFCTVSPGGGSYPPEMFTGGTIKVMTEDSQVIVTPLVRHMRDRTRRAEQALLSDEDGLTVRKHQILEALLGEDWEPVDVLGDYILKEQLAPRSAQAPGDIQVGKCKMVGMSLTFFAPFDWDIQPVGEVCAELVSGPCYDRDDELLNP